MEMRFKSQGTVQIIELAGALGEAEAAAVRFKLESKINQGRQKVLFDLSHYEIANSSAMAFLHMILGYALTRQVLVASSGLSSNQWEKLILNDGRQIKSFFSREEAFIFLDKTPAPNHLASLGEKAPAKAEEQKAIGLKKLLEKYEIFQHDNDLNPFRLDMIAEQYRASSQPSLLAVEKKAQALVDTSRIEIVDLEAQCDSMALKIKNYMLHRKSPLGGKELELKEKVLIEEINEARALLGKAESLLSQAEQKGQEAKKEADAETAELDDVIRELEKKIETTEKKNLEEEKSLKDQDAKEQLNFEAKMKSVTG